MKPSIRSTALAFLVVGGIGLFFGFTGFPKPTLIVGGAVAALAGLGILFRMRLAWLLGIGHTLINLGFSGLRLYQGIKGDEGGGILMPALWVVVSLYLLFSLLAIRESFKKYPAPGQRPDTGRFTVDGARRARVSRRHEACSAEGVPNIKSLPLSLRPRERMLSAGEKALSDVELIAVVLGGDLERAGAIIDRFGAAPELAQRGVAELCDIPGVGLARACQLQAALELGRRALTGPLLRGLALLNSDDVAERLGDMRHLENEELHVLALDSRHRLLVRFVAARGALNAVHVSPRDVLRRLVRESAAAMIVAHNHPSGDHTPSLEDFDLTRRLHAAGELVGVALIDHLVIGRHGFHSFAEEIRRFGGE